ncbi:MAG: nuclear transport factor 2 family protein [Kofleriaceae bacterium]
MIDPTRFMTEVLAMWFERDRVARRAAIVAHFHPDIRFVDHDGTFVGHDALERFSDSLQQRFPTAHFVVGAVEQLGDAVRAYWTLGRATGMDFAIFEGDKIKTLYAFVTPPPT